VAESLLRERACVIAVSRREALLKELAKAYPENFVYQLSDVRNPELPAYLADMAKKSSIRGIFVNAGGPPAKMIHETSTQDWEEAWQLLVKWKVGVVTGLLPHFSAAGYGRILFSESSSVKQPVENLVLSNSLRMAIVGFSKTISQEYGRFGVTSNVIAPGHHDTAALERLFRKKSEQKGIPVEEARKTAVEQIPAGRIGNPEDFADLAAWLLSPASGFVNGQVISLDGGAVKSSL
jgi:3-oxoacyl-[acyl-carrier protein] reductase